MKDYSRTHQLDKKNQLIENGLDHFNSKQIKDYLSPDKNKNL
jgi:hypothetical protein